MLPTWWSLWKCLHALDSEHHKDDQSDRHSGRKNHWEHICSHNLWLLWCTHSMRLSGSIRRRWVAGRCCRCRNMRGCSEKAIRFLILREELGARPTGVQSLCRGVADAPGICKHRRGHEDFWSVHHFTARRLVHIRSMEYFWQAHPWLHHRLCWDPLFET